MAPLIGLALSVLPSLAKRIVDNVLPDVESKVTGVVRNVLGTTDPAEIERKLQDAKLAAELRLALARIEAEADAREQQMRLETMRLQFETFRAELGDTKSARDTMTSLVKEGSIIAWGPVVVSTIVVVGFFVVLRQLVIGDIVLTAESQARFQIVNITVGALTAGFATVISFWLGSSQGSRTKDMNALRAQGLVADAQRESAQATRDIVTEQGRQTAALIGKVTAAPPPPAPAAAAPAKSARRFQRCMQTIFQHEGGYADHPHDPGGATNMGITHKTLAAWRKVESCTREEVRALTEEEATEIYRALYWNALNCDQLPLGVDLVTFDFGVNAGVGRAARMLQSIVGVEADGQIGPITLGAVKQMEAEFVITRFSERRLDYYKSLAGWETFGRGWERRTSETREIALRQAAEPARG
ncbi:glycoside hydrolase family 108 protein [Oceanicella sp. SM1341]|uniref:glycoside hydrolase family 108 protein n=1 Tax=Oceanicella sp. SM1341 TaxID=1548889 RepID=UPI000E5344D9|nr:glycoside hydrolase family 108 protein [Oceanicella sp. SM1341]